MERESIGTVDGAMTVQASTPDGVMRLSVADAYEVALTSLNAAHATWLRDKLNDFLGDTPLTAWQQQVLDDWVQRARARRAEA